MGVSLAADSSLRQNTEKPIFSQDWNPKPCSEILFHSYLSFRTSGCWKDGSLASGSLESVWAALATIARAQLPMLGAWCQCELLQPAIQGFHPGSPAPKAASDTNARKCFGLHVCVPTPVEEKGESLPSHHLNLLVQAPLCSTKVQLPQTILTFSQTKLAG